MGRTLLALAALLFVASSCFDEIPDATQGFVEIDTGGVSDAEVFVDDVSQGAATRVGPLDAGTHMVRVEKAYYDIAPGEQEVVVRATETAHVSFALTLVAAGAVELKATDELLGGDVDGAAILRLDDSGTPQPTGATTPATLERMPPGNNRFILRKDGFADTPITVDVLPFETAQVSVALGPPRAVLLEMFTFTSCSGCPESAAELRSLYATEPGQFFAIEWHSQAPFPLYQLRWKQRESYYSDAYMGGIVLPKPSILVQGGNGDNPAILIGSNVTEIAQYRLRFETRRDQCSHDCPVALKAVGTIDAATASYTVRAKWRGGALPANLVLRTVLLEHLIVAPGNDPPYSFVPRDIHEETVTFLTPGEVQEFPEAFSIQAGWLVDKMDVVVFLQSDDTKEILAVTGTRRVTLPSS